jgi:hypothetical protein
MSRSIMGPHPVPAARAAQEEVTKAYHSLPMQVVISHAAIL